MGKFLTVLLISWNLYAMDSGPLHGWFSYQSYTRVSPETKAIRRLQQEILVHQKQLSAMCEELEETKCLSEFAFAMWSRWFSVSKPRNHAHLCEQAQEIQEIINARQQRLNDLLREKE